MINKRLINTGAEAAPAAFDPLQNFEVVTYTGNGGTQKITGYIRKGAAFNGSSSKIELPNNAYEYTSFTVSLFAHSSDWTQSLATLYSFYDNDETNGGGFIGINNDVVCFFGAGGTSSPSITNGTTTLTDNTWYHILLKVDGTSVKVYLDGTEEISVTLGSNFSYRPTHQFTIGARDVDVNTYGYFNGKIDQLRIFNIAVTDANRTTLKNETYASSTKSTTDIFGDGSGVALYELDDTANDTGTNSGTIDSGQSIQGFSASNYAVFAPTGNFASNSTDGDGSISLWYNLNSIPSNGSFYTLIGKGNPTTGSTYQSLELNLFGTPNSNEIEFHFRRGFSGTNYDPTSYTSARVGALAGVWYNLVLTYASSTKTVTFYVNDNLVGSYSLTSSAGGRTIDSGFNIGIYTTASPLAFNGKLDEFRLYSDIVTSTEIGYLSSNDTGNIPTGNLEAYYKFDGNITDSSGNGNNGTLTGTLTYTDPAEIETSYNGTATNVNYLGMAFSPSLVWIKSRNHGYSHHIQDVIRGTGGTHVLSSDGNYYEGQFNYGSIDSFDTNGFTVGSGGHSTYGYAQVNESGKTYVAWCFKGADSAVSNTNGTITSQVSANQAAGFSIVKYNGTGNVATIGHGLSQAPDLIITKGMDSATNWNVYASPIGATKGLFLNESNAAATSIYYWNDTAPTSSVFTAYTDGGNENTIAYCFHSVDGYQKIGSYTGVTGDKVVTTGFRPRFLLVKNTSTAGNNWNIMDSTRDTTNPIELNLWADTSDSETTATQSGIYDVDFNDDGFTIKNNYYPFNFNGETYIYLAIA